MLQIEIIFVTNFVKCFRYTLPRERFTNDFHTFTPIKPLGKPEQKKSNICFSVTLHIIQRTNNHNGVQLELNRDITDHMLMRCYSHKYCSKTAPVRKV